MNPEIKLMWTTALRSGEYRQGMGQLRANDKYCCLGVLCDLAVTNQVSQWEESPGIHGCSAGQSIDGILMTLPLRIFEWSGMRNHSLVGELINLNDSDQHNFGEIAAWIDKNL